MEKNYFSSSLDLSSFSAFQCEEENKENNLNCRKKYVACVDIFDKSLREIYCKGNKPKINIKK